jgi:hypothetical protein
MRGLRPLARLLVVVLVTANGIVNFAHRHAERLPGGLRRAIIEPSFGSDRLPERAQNCLACQYLGSASLTPYSARVVTSRLLWRVLLPPLQPPPRWRLLGTAPPRGPPLDG